MFRPYRPANAAVDDTLTPAVAQDYIACLTGFLASDDLSFNSFKATWRAKDLGIVHHAQPTATERKQYTQALFGTALSLLAPIFHAPQGQIALPSVLGWKIGTLYLLYTLFATQCHDLGQRQRVRICPASWNRLTDLALILASADLAGQGDDALYIFNHLIAQDAFIFAAYDGPAHTSAGAALLYTEAQDLPTDFIHADLQPFDELGLSQLVNQWSRLPPQQQRTSTLEGAERSAEMANPQYLLAEIRRKILVRDATTFDLPPEILNPAPRAHRGMERRGRTSARRGLGSAMRERGIDENEPPVAEQAGEGGPRKKAGRRRGRAGMRRGQEEGGEHEEKEVVEEMDALEREYQELKKRSRQEKEAEAARRPAHGEGGEQVAEGREELEDLFGVEEVSVGGRKGKSGVPELRSAGLSSLSSSPSSGSERSNHDGAGGRHASGKVEGSRSESRPARGHEVGRPGKLKEMARGRGKARAGTGTPRGRPKKNLGAVTIGRGRGRGRRGTGVGEGSDVGKEGDLLLLLEGLVKGRGRGKGRKEVASGGEVGTVKTSTLSAGGADGAEADLLELLGVETKGNNGLRRSARAQEVGEQTDATLAQLLALGAPMPAEPEKRERKTGGIRGGKGRQGREGGTGRDQGRAKAKVRSDRAILHEGGDLGMQADRATKALEDLMWAFDRTGKGDRQDTDVQSIQPTPHSQSSKKRGLVKGRKKTANLQAYPPEDPVDLLTLLSGSAEETIMPKGQTSVQGDPVAEEEASRLDTQANEAIADLEFHMAAMGQQSGDASSWKKAKGSSMGERNSGVKDQSKRTASDLESGYCAVDTRGIANSANGAIEGRTGHLLESQADEATARLKELMGEVGDAGPAGSEESQGEIGGMDLLSDLEKVTASTGAGPPVTHNKPTRSKAKQSRGRRGTRTGEGPSKSAHARAGRAADASLTELESLLSNGG